MTISRCVGDESREAGGDVAAIKDRHYSRTAQERNEKKEGEVRQELAAPMTGRQREKTTHLDIQTTAAFIKDLMQNFLFIYIFGEVDGLRGDFVEVRTRYYDPELEIVISKR